MKFNLGRVPKHYKFEYVPRFYDPEEEERKKHEVDYSEGDASAKLKEQIRYGLKGQRVSTYAYRTQRSRQSAASNKRLMYIIGVMVFLGYLFWNSDRIERLLGLWESAAG